MKDNLTLNNDEEEIVAYSTEMILHNFITLSVVFLASWLAGCLPTAMTATFFVAVFRALTGGAHSESPVNCTIISTFAAVIIGETSIILGEAPRLYVIVLGILIFPVSLKFFLVLAPVDSPAKPITSKPHRKKLRMLSITALVSLFFIEGLLLIINKPVFFQYIAAASLAVAWQTFTLTSPGHKFRDNIDYVLNKILRR